MEDKNISNKTIVSSLWWKLLERLFSQGINLVVQIVLARILLPEDFGCLAIIVAITNYAAIFVQSGLATALIQKKNLDEKDVSTMLTASLTVALFLYVLLFVLSPWIAQAYNLTEILWPLRIQALVLFLNAIFSVQTAILSRNMDFKSIFIRTALAVPISGTVGIVMAFLGFGVWALVAHNLVHTTVMVLVMFFGTDMHLRLDFSLDRAKSMYSFSSKIMLSALICGFGDTVRTMTIGKTYTTSNLAYYDKAYSYSQYVVSIIHLSIQSVMLSVLARQQDDKKLLCATNRKTVQMVSFVMFPFLIGAIMTAKPLILLLLTEKWSPCIGFFMLFCFFRLIGCVTSVDKQAYYALGRSDVTLYYEMGLLFANLIMLFSTVKINIWAIAIGATIIEFFGCLTLCVISSRIYGYSLLNRLSDFSKPLLNSIVMAFALWGLSFLSMSNLNTLIFQIAVGIAIYYIMARISDNKNLKLFVKIISKKHTNKF
jgi:O-antigen/teichoic acid export membrane protein